MAAAVAWLDNGDRIGVCPRCIVGVMAENPGASDLRMVRIEEARGKACVKCDRPLAYELGTAMEIAEGPQLDDYGFLPVDGIEDLDELRERILAEEERDGDWLADEARIDALVERRAA